MKQFWLTAQYAVFSLLERTLVATINILTELALLAGRRTDELFEEIMEKWT